MRFQTRCHEKPVQKRYILQVRLVFMIATQLLVFFVRKWCKVEISDNFLIKSVVRGTGLSEQIAALVRGIIFKTLFLTYYFDGKI